MSKAITIRNVPDEVRDELAARAGRAGQSLQTYVRGLLVHAASRPSTADALARARLRTAGSSRVDAESILAARDTGRR